MDNFNLNEWVGKGEKNLLREGRDDDFTTTVSPEELDMHPDDHTLEEMDDDDIYDPNKDLKKEETKRLTITDPKFYISLHSEHL